ncbi:MAG: DNA gyrase subunit A [Paraclostridium sp.]
MYDAMKPMANWFETNIPLFTKQGNFGNMQGGSASAMRYTEAKPSVFTMKYVVKELKETKNIVDWTPTYNNAGMEPEFLPVMVPLLLINGSFGIGLGMSSRVPRHNINEVIDATIKLIQNPDSEVVLIPDQCMPCDIIETNFKAICNTGCGSFRVRARMIHEEVKIEGKRLNCLTITSLPDLTYFDSIEEAIIKLIEDRKILDILDIKDKSTETEFKCHIVLKKDSDPNYVRDFLYKSTDLEKTVSVSFEVIDGVDVMRMSYKSYLQYFIDFRKVTKFRYYSNKLQQVQTKLHEKEAFVKLFRSGKVNKVIDMIKTQNTTSDNALIEYLITNLGVTDLQASYIINANIKKLAVAYIEKYEAEALELNRLSSDYMDKLMNDDLLLQEIIEELKQFKKEYGTPRRSRVISKADISNIPKGDFTLVITEKNFIKKVPFNSTIGSFRDDSPKMILKVENTDNILIYDALGKVFKLPVHKIPVSDKNSNGIDVRKLSNKITANIINVMCESILIEQSKNINKHYLIVLTNNGLVKRLDLDDFTTTPPSGIVYNKLDQGDFVKEVRILPTNTDVVIYSKNTASRMHMNDIPHNKRNTKGSKSMSSDTVDGLAIIDENTTDILVITEGGKVNKISVFALPVVGRNKTGSKVIKLSKGDSIHSILSVSSTNTLLAITTKQNKYEFKISDIASGSSMSGGIKLISSKIDNILKTNLI